ncbi:hypothetical protein AB0D08_17580 [Kitasatospora sp. NPDC048540]|uniref:hypothetical protein n=1 Tax=unclassified Kitasatospora TaxID=2633591 RepID=UPI001314F106|nr:hypothetical protein [Kitasatospora sp. MBT63]
MSSRLKEEAAALPYVLAVWETVMVAGLNWNWTYPVGGVESTGPSCALASVDSVGSRR